MKIQGNGVSGVLAIEEPWPGQMRTIFGDHERLKVLIFNNTRGITLLVTGAEGMKMDIIGSPVESMM